MNIALTYILFLLGSFVITIIVFYFTSNINILKYYICSLPFFSLLFFILDYYIFKQTDYLVDLAMILVFTGIIFVETIIILIFKYSNMTELPL